MLVQTRAAGSDTDAQQSAMADAAPAETPTDSASYLTMAGASDLFEIQSSELALEKSQNAGGREFAQMMIDHHRKTTQDVTAATDLRRCARTPAAGR